MDKKIHFVSKFGSRQIIEQVLDDGANIDELGSRQDSPLHVAAQYGNEAAIELLLERGATINKKNGIGHTPLHYAILYRHIKCVQLLLENDAVNTSLSMCLAATVGNLEVVKLLHKSTKCDIDEMDAYSRNPLILAAKWGHVNVIKYLMDYGADIRCCDVHHWKTFLKLGVDVNHPDLLSKRTPLHKSGNVEVIKFLLSVDGIEVNVVDVKGNLPIHDAVLQNRLDVITLLIEKGADLNKRGAICTPLCSAVYDRNFNLIKQLVEAGADVNYEGCNFDEARTALQLALDFEPLNMEIVRYLLDQGATDNNLIHKLAMFGTVEDIKRYTTLEDIESVDESYNTPIFYALNNPNNLKYLISVGGNINHYNCLNITPIYLAIVHEHMEAIKILIKEGCELNYNSSESPGYTPLINTICDMNDEEGFEVFKLLVDNNASVTMADFQQKTPLHYAVEELDTYGAQIIQYLLEKGADVNVCDEGGLTPMAVAVESKNYEIVKLFILHGADVNLDPYISNLCEDFKCLRLLHAAGLKDGQSNPLDLKQLSRNKLCETYGKNYLKFVNDIFPKITKNYEDIKQYLLFNNL